MAFLQEFPILVLKFAIQNFLPKITTYQNVPKRIQQS